MIRAIIIAAALIGLAAPALAETNYAFILNSFPQCKGEPVFSPYSGRRYFSHCWRAPVCCNRR